MDDSKHLATEIPHTETDHTNPSIHDDSFNERYGDWVTYGNADIKASAHKGTGPDETIRGMKANSARNRQGVLGQ